MCAVQTELSSIPSGRKGAVNGGTQESIVALTDGPEQSTSSDGTVHRCLFLTLTIDYYFKKYY